MKTVFILSVSSDIGFYLAKRYLRDGCRVIGTHRRAYNMGLYEIDKSPDCLLFHCDIADQKSVGKFLEKYKKLMVPWDIFISCVGDLKPYGNFLDNKFIDWNNSVHINAIDQLRVLHGIYPLKKPKMVAPVIFFAGGGVNNAPIDLSAYTAAKIMLIKMCELLDAENPNLSAFTVGPGYLKTKIHDSIGKNIAEGKKEGNMESIYAGINWLIAQGKGVAGGRNFSIIHDELFGEDRNFLAHDLRKDKEMYKLRRVGN